MASNDRSIVDHYALPATIDDLAVASSPIPLGEPAAPIRLWRFLEGIDTAPRPLFAEEIAAENNDPFGLMLVGLQGPPPNEMTDLLVLLGAPGAAGTELSDQTIYIVSDTGQISLAEAPDLARNPRGVVLRRDLQARKAVFIASSMRQGGVLEAMGWDPQKGLFNFYERRVANGAPVWIWKGDSSHAWQEETRPHTCFACHRNGEVNMKELRVPWQNWHSQTATIKPESIPVDSPLRRDPHFSIEPPSPYLRGGQELEKVANQWIPLTNATKLAKFQAGKLPAANILEPFFRTTTLTLISSAEQSISVGNQPISLPVSFFIDQRGLMDVGQLQCSALLQVGGQLKVERRRYRGILATLGFRLEQPGAYLLTPGDTHFAFVASEVPRVDFELIRQLVDAGVVSRRMATSLMLIDFPNPVYSPVRARMFEVLVSTPMQASADGSLDQALVDLLVGIALDAAEPSGIREAAEAFVDRWNLQQADWQRAVCASIDAYLGAVAARFAAGDVEDYFKLLASRYADLFASDHAALIESHLLLPKTDPFAGLVMTADGAVKPFTPPSN